jgi:hypothetical protein
MDLDFLILSTRLRYTFGLASLLLAVVVSSQAWAGPKDEVRDLAPMWRANAPICFTSPSADDCHDGDMTLFNGLLCASGEELGCESVKKAQDDAGRWHRSVRYRQHPELRPDNSFSWDMALGVQLYSVTKNDKAALEKWLRWVEANRPCLSNISHDGRNYCIVRGLPRWCTDDTEKGCTAKPQGLALLYRTARYLGAAIPPPAVTVPPSGLPGEVIRMAIKEAKEANALFSLERLFIATEDLQPNLILIDAAVNREGFPRHLTATEIMLYRITGGSAADVDYAALMLAQKEPHNAFFQYLVSGSTDDVAQKVLALAPKSAAELPLHKADWTWQRAKDDEAWKRAKLWDFVFMANLLAKP